MTNNCKFVLTYAYCDWSVNGAVGVYDDPDMVMGKIIDMALDIWDSADPKVRGDAPWFRFHFDHDDENDNYYDVNIYYLWDPDKCDTYRVYYLRDESNEP